MNNGIKTIFDTSKANIKNIEHLLCFYREQNYERALRLTTHVLDCLVPFIDELGKNQEYFNQDTFIYDNSSITGMLTNLLDAQKNHNWILLADYYELQVLPLLLNIQEKIIQTEEYEFKEEEMLKTLHALEERDPMLYESLLNSPHPLDLMEQGYLVEYTSTGHFTTGIIAQSKFYMHSNYKVTSEALQLARSWYQEDKTDYIIYGLSFGYHISELHYLDENISIEVYESDINMIKLACAFAPLMELITHPNIKLIYDPRFSKIKRRLKDLEDSQIFLIHYPSLQLIKDSVMKEKLEDYFLQYSSVKNQSKILMDNFKNNINLKDPSVDILKKDFVGKDLYIIAAGPSLDKNFIQLKELSENPNAIILATGTVYRKLMLSGIRPDYIIVTDANKRVIYQISSEDLTQSGIPMLYLSTAYKGFSIYEADRYIVLQHGFPPAEKFAAEHDYQLYHTGGSVSTTALDIGITFGCRRIIFLGLDLSFTGNMAHADNTSRQRMDITPNLRQIKDIEGKTVYTNHSMDIYRKWMENRIKEIKNIAFIDATQGGAKIEGMEIMDLSQVIQSK